MAMRVDGSSKIRRRRDVVRSPASSTSRSSRSAGKLLLDTARVVLLLAIPSVALWFFTQSTVIGLAILVLCKFVAFVAMTAGRDRKGESIKSRRLMLTEAVTLGVLVAFVVNESLGSKAFVPRGTLMVDWASTLGLVLVRLHLSSFGRTRQNPVVAPEPEPEPLPEVRSAVRGRIVMLSLPVGKSWNCLVDQIDALDPGGWIVSGGDPERTDRIAAALTRVNLRHHGLRDVFAAGRPSVVFHVLDSHIDRDEARALITRRLAQESLRAGADCFVLVTPEGDPGIASVLSERIIGALSGLTRTRMVRVRLENGVDGTAAARRILRLAAKGRDGSIVSLGKTGGSCVAGLARPAHSTELWAELDQIGNGLLSF